MPKLGGFSGWDISPAFWFPEGLARLKLLTCSLWMSRICGLGYVYVCMWELEISLQKLKNNYKYMYILPESVFAEGSQWFGEPWIQRNILLSFLWICFHDPLLSTHECQVTHLTFPVPHHPLLLQCKQMWVEEMLLLYCKDRTTQQFHLQSLSWTCSQFQHYAKISFLESLY